MSEKQNTHEDCGSRRGYPLVGSRVEVVDGSEAHGDKGYVFDVSGEVCLIDLDAGCIWPIAEPREVSLTGEKSRVFEGGVDACQEFVRANRFNVLMSQMEIQCGWVYAFRNDG